MKTKPTSKELRNFGLIWAGIFLFFSILPIFKDGYLAVPSLLIGLGFILISSFNPDLFYQINFYQTWLKFGNLMGKVNSKIIIFILFYLVFLPIGIILKILKKDLLRKKLDKSLSTYFIDRTEQPINMKNQF